MKKLMILFLLLACNEEPEQVLVQVYKIEQQFFHCNYYIYAVAPQLPISTTSVILKCGVYKVGDQFLIDKP